MNTFALIFSSLISASLCVPFVLDNNNIKYGFPEQDVPQKQNYYFQGRITNAEVAKPHSAKFMVSIKSGDPGTHICGGSIITKNTILTAAHCVGPNLYVVAGLHDRSDETNAQIIKVKGYAGHDKYNGGMAPFDIGVLHLETPLEFDDKVQPINLPSLADKEEGEVTLLGWGRTIHNSYNLPHLLQSVEIDLISNEECYEELPDTHKPKLHETNICSSSRDSHISACNADSGGPLVQLLENNTYQQVGIVSWGVLPCGTQNKPSVYTHIGSHLEWIKINTRK